jgi:hypothetical protein
MRARSNCGPLSTATTGSAERILNSALSFTSCTARIGRCFFKWGACRRREAWLTDSGSGTSSNTPGGAIQAVGAQVTLDSSEFTLCKACAGNSGSMLAVSKQSYCPGCLGRSPFVGPVFCHCHQLLFRGQCVRRGSITRYDAESPHAQCHCPRRRHFRHQRNLVCAVLPIHPGTFCPVAEAANPVLACPERGRRDSIGSRGGAYAWRCACC